MFYGFSFSVFWSLQEETWRVMALILVESNMLLDSLDCTDFQALTTLSEFVPAEFINPSLLVEGNCKIILSQYQ